MGTKSAESKHQFQAKKSNLGSFWLQNEAIKVVCVHRAYPDKGGSMMMLVSYSYNFQF